MAAAQPELPPGVDPDDCDTLLLDVSVSRDELMRMTSDEETGNESEEEDEAEKEMSIASSRSKVADSAQSASTDEAFAFDPTIHAAAVYKMTRSHNRRGAPRPLMQYSRTKPVHKPPRRETPLTALREILHRAKIPMQHSYIFIDFQCFKEDGLIIPCEFAIRAIVHTVWQFGTEHPDQRFYQTANTQFGLVGATKPFSTLTTEEKHTNNFRRQEVHGIWYTSFDNGRRR